MSALSCLLLAAAIGVDAGDVSLAALDTLRLRVGSKAVNGRIYRPHAARVRVHIGDATTPSSEWTNELTLGDSAGRPVMFWVTRGTQHAQGVTWELRQNYDAETLAPYAYALQSSRGGYVRLSFEGRYVRGVRRMPGDTADRQINLTLDEPGFIASASDLVPLAAGLKDGVVMTAPMWSPGMTNSEMRIFTVVGKVPVNVEGTEWTAWKVEERRHTDHHLLATWWLVERSPYMVYGEVILPDGRIQRMTEVEIPSPGR